MEHVDPAKNDECSGFSKRRISSILKAPRKSIRFPEPEQQENVVECAKPVEKRNSRRVSFAPANDVLLFAKDVKNASPARSPLLQLITTTAATHNRVQVAVTEDGTEQIAGMETLLNAPLHASQQTDAVNFDTAADFGEKTVRFSTDDAFMDMTHSHTINIAGDAESLADISLQDYNIFPTGRGKTVMLSAEDGSTLSHPLNMMSGSTSLPTSRNVNSSVEKGNVSSSVPCLDPGFENFLASLSKPGGPSVNPMITRTMPPAGSSAETNNGFLAQIKTKRPDMDKENQAPTSVSAVFEKSLHASRKIGESSYGSGLYPADSINMDMTEAHTGHIQGLTDDDPFQCLFPTQEMYSHFDNRVSQTAEKTKQQQSSETLASFNPKDTTSLTNPSVHASHQGQKVNLDIEDEGREKTIMLTAGIEFMDMTQSHTVNIASGSLASSNKNMDIFLSGKMDIASPLKERRRETCGPSGTSANALDPGFKNFLASLSTPSAPSGNPAATCGSFGVCPENDLSMDLTETRTGRITGLTGSDHPFQFGFATQDTHPLCEGVKSAEMTSGQKTSQELASSSSSGMKSSLNPSLKTQVHQVKCDTRDECREKTVRFTANDACMDVTQSHTVNIDTSLGLQSHQNVDFLPACGEKTVRFTAKDAAMDVTQSHTVNIDTNLGPQPRINVDFLPTSGEKTVRFTANDACMDVTQSHTVRIDTNLGPQPRINVDFLPACGEKTVRFTAKDAAMDVTQSHTVNIDTNLGPQPRINVDFLPACGEKTVRFTAKDAAMDVTQSHTVNIDTNLGPQPRINVDFLPACGEKTVRFTAKDAAMDVTQSHTVNIDTNLGPQPRINVDFLPACGEKTVRFTAKDAAMDVTQSHTVNIDTNLGPQPRINVDFLPACGEKTVRFTAKDAAMDVTQSHTVNIDTNLGPQPRINVDFLPACGEKTVRFTAKDAAMDVTQSHTVNIDTNSVSDSVLPHQDSILSTLCVKRRESETCPPRRNRSSARALDLGLKNSLSKTSGPWAKPVITKAAAPAAVAPQETVDSTAFLDQLEIQKPDVDTGNELPGLVSAVTEKPEDPTTTQCLEDDVSMEMTEALTGHMLGQTCADKPPRFLSSTQDFYPDSEDLNKAEATSQQHNEALGSSSPDGVEITDRPDSLDSDETDARKEAEPRNQAGSPGAADHHPSQKSRRKSLADLHFKLRRLSHIINTAPDGVAMDGCTALVPQLEHDMDQNLADKAKSLPVMEPELNTGLVNTEEDTQAQSLQEEQPSTSTSPFNFKIKQFMSRLSVGGFKPKLPKRSKPDDPEKVYSVGDHTRNVTVNVTNQLSNVDKDVSDIYDEELGSCEDMSEMLDVGSPQKATENVSPSREFNVDELEEDVFEHDFISGNKRPLPVDENNVEDEKRRKTSAETAADFEVGSQSGVVESAGNITTAPVTTTQSTDDSNSTHTASIRCEATFESTFKQSLFESQLEDYANDVQRKLDDGTITVLEFFNLFNIDFVIHNPRQSFLPGRLLSDTDRTPMDLLKDRHINRPKQAVYETNTLSLTEKVEKLKVRKRDLDKPLKIVNRPLWEEMRNSSEKELKSFGAKLKERNNLFRKTSKVQSHEMKEVLYSSLVRASVEEQRRLRGTIQEADEMLKHLDDCICQVETELAAVEEKGFEDTPGLKSCQEEMQKVTEAMADNERQTTELEMQKKQNSNKLKRLKAETRKLESHVTVLHTLSEFKIREKRDNSTVYSFLYDTLHLQLVYENSSGSDADNQSERNISHITFIRHMDGEKSQCHACLVHKLLSQYTEGETSWVEKYPTSTHVPQLLRDVGLVVSRCRLLGEELRLLKMWGGLRLDILDIRCVDTQVHIVFSSLKTCSKFELIFSVSLTDHLYVLQLQSFRNVMGSTTIQQIEEIVASFSPARNLLTKIVKRIHGSLLC